MNFIAIVIITWFIIMIMIIDNYKFNLYYY
jgi:hypothetical protein